MAESKKNIMTYDGVKTLENELENLKVVRRKEVAQKIAEAREQGDLSENAEYDAAMEEQREIELRIQEIDTILRNAEVADDDEASAEVVTVGCFVTLLDKEFDEKITYQIVGATEANILKNKISNESPVGKAVLGQKKNKTIKVETPAGITEYKIVKIEKTN